MPHAQGGDSRQFAAQASFLKIRPHAKGDACARGRAHSAQKRLQKARSQCGGGGIVEPQIALSAQLLHVHMRKQAAGNGPKQGNGRPLFLLFSRGP